MVTDIPPGAQDAAATLASYAIFDTPADDAFERITRLLADQLEVPVALVSLVDTDRLWFKSHYGTVLEQTALVPGLCGTTILSDGLHIVQDTLSDPATAAHPLVAGAFGARAYAGAPIVTADGIRVGAVAAIDFEPRTFAYKDQVLLRGLADLAAHALEAHRARHEVTDLTERLRRVHGQLRNQAARDGATGVWNERAIMEILDRSLAQARRDGRQMSVMLFGVDFLDAIGERYGRSAANGVLRAVANRVVGTLRNTDVVGRVGTEEFLCVLSPCDPDSAALVAERCRRLIHEKPVLATVDNEQIEIEVSASIGVFSRSDAADLDAEHVFRNADVALYRAKRAGRNRVAVF